MESLWSKNGKILSAATTATAATAAAATTAATATAATATAPMGQKSFLCHSGG